jgi:glutamine amidotransferase
MKVAILQYNAGNIRSVFFALKRLGVEPIITNDIEELNKADKIIFPGVGEASSAMKNLRENKLDNAIVNFKQPVLGICLGMQLLCKYSEEGNTDGLAVFNNNVKRFPKEKGIKIPHIGWNTISKLNSELYENLKENDYVYFVHSYYADVNENTNAVCNYILEYSAGLQKNNFYATQFHPEKSGDIGEKILQNFLNI